MKYQRLFIVIVFILSLFVWGCSLIYAQQALEQQKPPQLPQQDYAKARIVSVEQGDQMGEQIKVMVLDGEKEGEEVQINMLHDAKTEEESYQAGDVVLIVTTVDQAGNDIAYIADRMRTMPLLLLFTLFVGIVLLVGRIHGIASLAGMVFSFLIIIQFIVPQIVLGNNPLLIALLGGLIITPVTFYISHGLNAKTTIAVAGTFIALVWTGLLSWLFVELAHLSGFTGDESVFIQTLINDSIDMKNLLLAGMIIGTMGILDDITVSQSSIVSKLASTNPRFTFRELFLHAMDVGKDHIASLVNTLVLVYAGAALPLFLLFSRTQEPFSYIVNNEIIATEIVRMLVGTSGLVSAVPITTFLATWWAKKS